MVESIDLDSLDAEQSTVYTYTPHILHTHYTLMHHIHTYTHTMHTTHMPTAHINIYTHTTLTTHAKHTYTTYTTHTNTYIQHTDILCTLHRHYEY